MTGRIALPLIASLALVLLSGLKTAALVMANEAKT